MRFLAIFWYIQETFVLKKLLAITLLIVHLFNLAGYYILFEYFIARSDQQLVSRLDDRQYTDAELIEVKLPLHLPYLSNWNEYERINGEMEYNGIYYNYVKRKVSNDTLFLLCLPNSNKTQLHNARHAYARQVNGTPSGDHTGNTQAWKINITTEYNQPQLQFDFTCWAEPVQSPRYNLVPRLIHPFIAAQYRPPQVNG